MIKINIGGHQVALTRFFNAADLSMAREWVGTKPAATVVCLDTPPTPVFADFVRELVASGRHVVVRDHHDVAGEPSLPRDVEIRAAADAVRALAARGSVVSNRVLNPACSSLVNKGEFGGDGFTVMADADMDGLIAAMKALGVVYDGLDADAAILDGPSAKKSAAYGLSPLGELLNKAGATLPPFNSPSYEAASAALYESWVSATQGDEAALAALATKVSQFDEMVAKAKAIATTATEVAPGVWLADVVGERGFHLATLATELESLSRCRITVVRKDDGPIAKIGGVQFSLARHSADKDFDLKSLLPSGFVSSPETGMIGNVPFLLHVSESVWNDTVLPALIVRFAA